MTFWVLPSSKALCLVDAEDVLRINVDGQIVSQGSPSDDCELEESFCRVAAALTSGSSLIA